MYKCDSCGEETYLKKPPWITLGGNERLTYSNNTDRANGLIYMNNHRDIHFCSIVCFAKYFTPELLEE